MPTEWLVQDEKVRPSPVLPGCLFCPSCQAHYKPGLAWGYVMDRLPTTDTSSRGPTLSGVRRLGTECPFCRRKP